MGSGHGMVTFVLKHSQPIGDHPLADTIFLEHSMDVKNKKNSPTLAMSIGDIEEICPPLIDRSMYNVYIYIYIHHHVTYVSMYTCILHIHTYIICTYLWLQRCIHILSYLQISGLFHCQDHHRPSCPVFMSWDRLQHWDMCSASNRSGNVWVHW